MRSTWSKLPVYALSSSCLTSIGIEKVGPAYDVLPKKTRLLAKTLMGDITDSRAGLGKQYLGVLDVFQRSIRNKTLVPQSLKTILDCPAKAAYERCITILLSEGKERLRKFMLNWTSTTP
jgi:hypothetical protein